MDSVDLARENALLKARLAEVEAALRGKGMEAPRKPRRNRGHLPAHLPRVERVIEPASTQCPCGCGEMAKIGEVEEDQETVPRTVC